MLRDALALAARGWPVFPLAARSKVPFFSAAEGGRGCLDATTDESRIREHWTRAPHSNIGLATGRTSGLFVVDVDAGKGGSLTMQRLTQEHGRLPDTLRSRTGSGWHLFFAMPETPVRQGADVLGPGVDTRSTGGYVVAPPSVHPSGRSYRWLTACAPAALPPWLALLVEPKAPSGPAVAPPVRPADVDVVERARRYLAHVEPAVMGQNGSTRCMWAAVCMVRGFMLDAHTALALLESEWNPRCQPPWSRRELVHKIESAEGSSRPLGFLLAAPRRRAA